LLNFWVSSSSTLPIDAQMGLTPLFVVLLFLGIAAAVNMKAQHGGKSVLPTRTLPTDMLEVKRAAKVRLL